jgi:hypothetical protein
MDEHNDINELNDLMNALENDSNENIMNFNSSLIQKIKNDNLQRLLLPREKLKEYHKKLKDYRYVDDLESVQYGRYIRWIPLKNPDNIYLTNGGIIVDIKILQKGIYLVCKNNRNRIFQIHLDENMIFQKISDQEKTIISVLDYIQK